MAIPYRPRKFKSDYEIALGGDPNKLSDFAKVWAFITNIRLDQYVRDYNIFEKQRNVTGLTTLGSTVKASIDSIEAEKLIYKDIAVQAPLNDYLIRLREVESEIDKTVKALTPSTRSGLCRIVDVSLSYKRKFEMFTSQVGKPANDALNFAQGVIDSKGKKLYSLDPFNRKKK